ncbi:hypothetical protein NECAME_08715 [Necator americanus]|uniref:Uncharacterized protein n=1 Tax=Necator americanus TaxID=51031 RepID=W2THL7_NECAM|nr:hypothetical protein NECAME_08715 [Necator americanus]ETN81094.1 hypothetical protein NECAME_08715 [Necator americanus]
METWSSGVDVHCGVDQPTIAYPVETVRFEWFTRRADAIDKNPDVKLPELYIDRYEPTKKWSLKVKADMTEDQRDMMVQKAQRYHKTGRQFYKPYHYRLPYPPLLGIAGESTGSSSSDLILGCDPGCMRRMESTF